VPDRYEIIKWSIARMEPALNAPSISPVVSMKIAYEYLALHVGTAVLHPQLDPVRALLRIEPVSMEACLVERFVSLPYAPFHDLVLDGNVPHAVVQIRLFGGAGLRVHFQGTGIGGVRLKYTHDLERGEEDFRILGTETNT